MKRIKVLTFAVSCIMFLIGGTFSFCYETTVSDSGDAPIMKGSVLKNYNKGRKFLMNGDNLNAIRYLNRALKISPKNTSVLNTLGTAYQHQKKYSIAMKYFKKALKIDPNDFVAYINIGVIYMELKKYEFAVANFRKAYEIDPESEIAQQNLQIAENYLKVENAPIGSTITVQDGNVMVE